MQSPTHRALFSPPRFPRTPHSLDDCLAACAFVSEPVKTGQSQREHGFDRPCSSCQTCATLPKPSSLTPNNYVHSIAISLQAIYHHQSSSSKPTVGIKLRLQDI